MRDTRMRIVALALAVAAGFIAGRLTKETPAKAQVLTHQCLTEYSSWNQASILTASADGTRIYVWTLHPTAKAENEPSPRCLGYADAKFDKPKQQPAIDR